MKLRRCRHHAAVVQIAFNQVAVVSLDYPDETKILSLKSTIKGVDLWKQQILIWSDTDADVYELVAQGINHVAKVEIQQASSAMAIHNDSIFVTTEDGVKVMSLQGEKKQSLLIDEFQGKIMQLEVSKDLLVAVTTENRFRLWKIHQNSDVKVCGLPSGRKVVINNAPIGRIESVRCNSDGTKISFVAEAESGKFGLDSRLFVYDDTLDKVLFYDFVQAHRRPVTHCWDDDDPRLLACQTIQMDENSHEPATNEIIPSSQVSTFFVTSDYPQGIYKFEKMKVTDNKLRLMGVSMPYLHFYLDRPQLAEDFRGSEAFQKRLMRNFFGLEEVDDKTKKSLMNFNYNLLLGPIMQVAAYKSISWIQDQKVWRSLASNCVKTKRLDIAIYCFGRMEDAWGAELIEKTQLLEPEEDARVAMIALQLGQIDDAKELYRQCHRYDLLNQLHQHCCEWDQAIEVATKFDRVHLKNTHHAYGKYLETKGKLQEAIDHFEHAGTHRVEVPRMLYAAHQIDDLQNYIDRSSDSTLQRWWGHYCEANDLLTDAVEYYSAAGDVCSLVRVHCHQKDLTTASNVVLASENFAGAFQLAREYEKIGEVRQSIQFYTKAGKSTYAAQLAMKHGVDNELLPLSLQSSKETMITSAKYFEGKGMNEEAAVLYQKGGDLESAVNVCFRSQLFEALKYIAEDLVQSNNDVLLEKCGDYLMQHMQSEKAVQLFIAAKQHRRALEICVKEGIAITEAMADAIAPKLSHPANSEQENNLRNHHEDFVSLLMRLAECCHGQGSYHLACRKYTQAGDHVAAMKSLLQSGDTERIIFFANVSRQKQVFTLAANYLQTQLDWHNDPDTMKTIVQMYVRAGEMGSLALFYEACAQIEIDEFHDHEKALSAMSEALKYLQKSSLVDKSERIASLENRIVDIQHVVEDNRRKHPPIPPHISVAT